MKRKIDEFFDNEAEYVSKLADEIIFKFMTEANQNNIEYSFTISRSSGKISSRDVNTTFSFDTDKGTCLEKFKKALYDKDLSDIKKDTPLEQSLLDNVRNFMVKVSEYITANFSDKLREIVRNVILDNRVDENTTPLKEIQIVMIDVADWSSVPESAKYILRVGKVPGTQINTDYIVEFIQDKQEETGQEIEEIVAMEKAVGNPQFDNVIAVEKGKKYLNDIVISMFVDYSLNIDERDENNDEMKA